MLDRHRKILRAILFISIIPSMYFGIKAMLLDLYNPGSLEARDLNGLVNTTFWITVVIALPLVYEKIKKGMVWINKFESLNTGEQSKMIWQVTKPIVVQILIVVALAVVAAIVLTSYFDISPDVIQNYKDYYSKDSFNYYNLNNITINQTEYPNTPIEYINTGE